MPLALRHQLLARRNAPLPAWTGLQCRLRTAISHITMSSMWAPRTRARKPKAGPQLRRRCGNSARSISTWLIETGNAISGTYILPMIRRRHASFTSTAAIGRTAARSLRRCVFAAGLLCVRPFCSALLVLQASDACPGALQIIAHCDVQRAAALTGELDVVAGNERIEDSRVGDGCEKVAGVQGVNRD